MNVLDVEEERGHSELVIACDELDAVVASIYLLKANIWVNDRERIKQNEYSYLQSAPTGMGTSDMCREE